MKKIEYRYFNVTFFYKVTSLETRSNIQDDILFLSTNHITKESNFLSSVA